MLTDLYSKCPDLFYYIIVQLSHTSLIQLCQSSAKLRRLIYESSRHDIWVHLWRLNLSRNIPSLDTTQLRYFYLQTIKHLAANPNRFDKAISYGYERYIQHYLDQHPNYSKRVDAFDFAINKGHYDLFCELTTKCSISSSHFRTAVNNGHDDIARYMLGVMKNFDGNYIKPLTGGITMYARSLRQSDDQDAVFQIDLSKLIMSGSPKISPVAEHDSLSYENKRKALITYLERNNLEMVKCVFESLSDNSLRDMINDLNTSVHHDKIAGYFKL
jgi:hypothetical protein